MYRNANDILMTDVTQVFVVGKRFVEGVRCDHLAFRAPHVDWQTWIQEGKIAAALSPGCTGTPVGGVEDYRCGSTCYSAAFQGNNLVYAVVPAP